MRKLRYVGTLLKDTLEFAREEKAYWLVPLVLVLLLFSFVVVNSQTSLPYIYTLF